LPRLCCIDDNNTTLTELGAGYIQEVPIWRKWCFSQNKSWIHGKNNLAWYAFY